MAATAPQTFTKVADIGGLVSTARAHYETGATLSVAWRREQLNKLHAMLTEGRSRMVEALRHDLRQTDLVADMEVDGPLKEVEFALENLEQWMQADERPVPLLHKPGSGQVVSEPYGVVAILAPFNFPFSLLLKPLVGALAAGNCAVLKPSEVSEQCGRVTAELVAEYFDEREVAVVCGAVPETTELLKHRFDFIMYTGNGMVGRIVMRAASEYLTPVLLELGGKSPCIVDSSANLDVAARRIIWGRTLNAGQVCVAPDYVLVTRDVEQALLERLEATIRQFFTDEPSKSKDFSRIINTRHVRRIKALLDAGGFDTVCGGQVDEQDHYVAPTVLTNVDPKAPIMQEEIFGPVLPVLPVDSVRDAIHFVNSRPNPLALYLFSESAATQRQVIAATHSGGMAINEVVMQVICPCLPFGGRSESGQGAYNGKATFDAFSHKKSVLTRATWTDPMLRYPPYTDGKVRMLKFLNSVKMPKGSLILAFMAVPIALLIFQLFVRSKL